MSDGTRGTPRKSSTPTLAIHQDIHASPSTIWAILEGVRLLPTLSPSTTAAVGPPALQQVGDRFDQTVKLGGRHFTSSWSVTGFEFERCLRVEGSVLPGTQHAITETITSESPTTATLTMSIDYTLPLGLLGRLAAKLGAERRALDEATQVVASIRETAERSPAANRTKQSKRST